jgi:manganese/zinc/iron transport system substrate-binding protein
MFFGFSKTLVPPVLAALVAAAGCGTAESPRRSPGKPRVLATTTVVADLVRQVAGDRAEVECLMAPGIDPHSYRPTPADADRLARADLIVAAGLQLEGRLAALVERLAPRRPVLAVGDRLPRDRLLAVTDELFDPHVWFDAGLWSLCPPMVAEALAAIDPTGAAGYRERAAAQAAALAALDADVRERIATIPQQRRLLVTAHDAFRYFGRAYGIEVVGVQGTSTESEAGLHDVNRLVELLVSRGIPAVFVETSVADRSVAALIEGARARGQAVTIGGRLYSDSLGEPGSGADTLAAALSANVETIVAALVDGGR